MNDKAMRKKAVKAWMIVNYNGNPITTDCRLPIYWLRKIAKEDLESGTKVVRVLITEVIQ